MSDKPFFATSIPRATMATPFDMFMARLVGQKNAICSSDGVIVYYSYKGRIFVDGVFNIADIRKPPKQK